MTMKISRRIVLKGVGGAVLALPFLEGLAPRGARAGMESNKFAIFFRQANGVAQAQGNDEIGDEPDRFWPTAGGALSPATMEGRAVDELSDHAGQLLMLRNVNYEGYDYGDGHANGCMQALTARGPVVSGAGGDSEASGESIDHRIGAELNQGGRDSLFLFAGQGGGWLNGGSISYRGPNNRRSAIYDPWSAYETVSGGDTGMSDAARMQLVERQRSVNDLVGAQLTSLLSRPQLSTEDRRRLDLHLSSIRDLEVALTCRASEDLERMIEGMAPGYDSNDGDDTLRTARLHMEVAALAVACGYTTSVAIQVGVGNDGHTRYHHPESGEPMENYHYISHRRSSHDSSGTVIAGSDLLHHYVDRQFAQTFKHLLDRLSAYAMPDGNNLLHHGVAIWYNDNSNGPPHSVQGVPWILGGSCNGYFKQGEVVELGGRDVNLRRLLHTIATGVGVTSSLDDFGDPSLPGGLLPELMA
jgi:hypothetical protein